MPLGLVIFDDTIEIKKVVTKVVCDETSIMSKSILKIKCFKTYKISS